MRALVTGGGGFIGSRLVGRLAASGTAVRAIARSDSSAATLREHGCEIVVGDLLDPRLLRDAVERQVVVE